MTKTQIISLIGKKWLWPIVRQYPRIHQDGTALVTQIRFGTVTLAVRI
jgi:hypothetical protein